MDLSTVFEKIARIGWLKILPFLTVINNSDQQLIDCALPPYASGP